MCFGVEKFDGDRLFLKFADAPTARSGISTREAVERMKGAVLVHEALNHPALIKQIEYGEKAGGYLTVFEWFEGACMGLQYNGYRRFLPLPIEEKLAIYSTILEFHQVVSSRGYVAIDFYDGCVMYDFGRKITKLCDVEFYSKMPYINEMGRMWGSSRYMSPEEFELGAVIDERSNVFALGSMAFELFNGRSDHSIESWPLSKKLHDVAMRAVSPERNLRQPSITALMDEWNADLRQK